MRVVTSAIFSGALILSVVGQVAPANALAGYDSEYAGESAFLTLNRGQTGAFTVFFLNTGTTTWTKGTSTQVDLAACLDDKVTCNAQDATDAPFNPGTWVSSTRYATPAQAAIAPGQVATFTYSVTVPGTQSAGTYRFNGALVLASTGADIRNDGYYQDVTVPVAPASITITPATDTNQIGSTHQVKIKYTDTAGAPVANASIDVFVVNDASPFTSSGACSVDSSASPGQTGTACTIDSGDFLTNSSGEVTFSYTSVAKETHRIIAWTGSLGAAFDNDEVTLKGSATKTWVGAVGAADATPESKKNPFATSHTVTTQLAESEGGTAVALSGQTVRVTLYRDTVDNANEAAASGTNGCTGAVVSTSAISTDAAGKATFTYTGPADSSSATGSKLFDCVFVHYDADGDNILDSGEKTDTVGKEWNDETSTVAALSLSPTIDANPQSSTHTVTATLTDQFGNGVSGGVIRFTVARRGATATSDTVQSSITLANSARTTGSDGKAAFGYVGPTASSEDTVDACYDKNDDGDCDDTGEITLASVTDVKKWWATAAATGNTKAAGSDVVFCDTSNDQVYVQDAAQTNLLRYAYDSGDQFTIGGTPKTMADFETDCGTADTMEIPTYDTGGVSSFKLTNN